MNRQLYIHTLHGMRDVFQAEHMDTQVEALDAAIEALEKPTDGDCISRKDVLNWLNDEWDGMVLSVFDGIRNFPSAQPEPRWIPVTERLPEKEGYYWTVHSYMSGHIGYNIAHFAKDLYKVDEYDFAEWKGVPGFFTIDDEYGYIKVDAIAWMPIEPWRGEK